jgi:hypothetical protein
MFPTWQPFEWIVAIRFLREGRLQTLFIVAGVAIGVAVIVFMSALMTGLQQSFIHRVLSTQGHIQLLPPRQVARPLRQGTDARPGEVEGATVQIPPQTLQSIDQWQAVALQVRAMPGVRDVSPVAGGSALVVRGNASKAVAVVGMEPALYYRIIALDQKMVRGTAQLGGADLLVGTDLATDLGVDVGDKLRLSTAAGAGATTTLRIAGLFDLGNRGANARNVFVALHTGQSLLALPGGVTSRTWRWTMSTPPRPSHSASPRPPVSKPTAGSAPTPNSSPPSARRTPRTPRSASSWACRWPSASPACWRWWSCRSRARSASCARWASRRGRSCGCSCSRAGCSGWVARLPAAASGSRSW